MRRYVIRRLLQAVILLAIMSVLFFLLIHAIPGGPERLFFSPHQTAAERHQIVVNLGLDQPLYVQYLKWVEGLLHGDLGRSFDSQQPVTTEIAARIPATLELLLTSLCVALVLAILLGVFSAVRQYSIGDYVITIFAYFGISMPVFWFALVLQTVFGVNLHWMPIYGRYSLVRDGFSPTDYILDYLIHLVLPTIVLSLLFIAGWSRYLRSSMLDVIKQDYIRTARAKGLGSRVVLFRHALRNALIPLITVVTLAFGGIFSGAVITETVFAWPGLGSRFLDALGARDYPVMLAMLLLSSAAIIVANLVADVLYAVTDPRIRYS